MKGTIEDVDALTENSQTGLDRLQQERLEHEELIQKVRNIWGRLSPVKKEYIKTRVIGIMKDRADFALSGGDVEGTVKAYMQGVKDLTILGYGLLGVDYELKALELRQSQPRTRRVIVHTADYFN